MKFAGVAGGFVESLFEIPLLRGAFALENRGEYVNGVRMGRREAETLEDLEIRAVREAVVFQNAPNLEALRT